MRKTVWRVVVSVALFGVMAASGWTLLADPATVQQSRKAPDSFRTRNFQPCPCPPCMAPCLLNGAPEVLCKTSSGVSAVTYFCCCCGGSGNGFRPLPTRRHRPTRP